MDFQIAYQTAALVSFALLALSTLHYGLVLRRVYPTLSKESGRALVMYGAATLMLGLQIVFAAFVLELARVWVVMFFLLMVNGVGQVAIPSRVRRLAVAILTVPLSAYLIIMLLLSPPGFEVIRSLMLFAGLLVTAGLSVRFVRRSLSAFSMSNLVLLILFVVSWYSQFYGIFAPPAPQFQYFPLLIAPSVVASAILVSIRRPWRMILTYSALLLAVTICVANLTACAMSGTLLDAIIVPYVLAGTFASVLALVPLGYFVDQAVITRARSPLFMSITIMAVSILESTHTVSWAIATMTGNWSLPHAPSDLATALMMPMYEFQNWDPNMLYVSWIIGLVAVFSFSLAALSSTFSERAISLTIDLLVLLIAALLTLAHPVVMESRYELSDIYGPVIFVLLAGVSAFVWVARGMQKSGSGKAAGRYLRFVFAALAIGMIAMFSDRLVLGLVVVSLLGAGLVLIGSSPTGVAWPSFLKRGFGRQR